MKYHRKSYLVEFKEKQLIPIILLNKIILIALILKANFKISSIMITKYYTKTAKIIKFINYKTIMKNNNFNFRIK